MRSSKKSRQLPALALAACMAFSLVFSANVPGVFAAEDSAAAPVTETAPATAETAAPTATQAPTATPAPTQAPADSEDAPAEQTSADSEDTPAVAALYADEDEGTEVQAEDAVTALIDADVALLTWKASDDQTQTTVTVNGTDYIVTDDSTYTTAYNAVYNALLEKADVPTKIAGTNVTADTVWNISSNIEMQSNMQVANGARLVILGDGTITRTGSYTITNYGTLCMQGSVYFDGNKKTSSLLYVNGGTAFLTDEFRLGNSASEGLNEAAGTFYMLGGLIGTKDITFTWYNENNQLIGEKDYEETLAYIKEGLDGTAYDYIRSVTATGGNAVNGVRLSGTAAFYMKGGSIAGNTAESGGGISASTTQNVTIDMTGGVIIGNKTGKGSGGALNVGGKVTTTIKGGMIVGNYSTTYAGGINTSATTNLIENAILAYNSCEFNGGGALIGQDSTCTMRDNAAVVHNRAIGRAAGEESYGNSGKGGAFRVVGTLDIQGGKINYNYGNGIYGAQTYNQDVGGAISGQTDQYAGTNGTIVVRKATVNLTGGEIAYNKANGRGGAIWLASLADYDAKFVLNGTKIHDNEAKSYGGGVYMEAREGTLTADILSGELSNNKAADNGGGIYLVLSATNLNAVGKKLSVNIGGAGADNSALKVIGNKSDAIGGGLYVARTTSNTTGNIDVNMYSGTLQGNTAQNGGALGVVRGSLNINGGVFSNNTAAQNGGGAYVADGKVHMFGGDITGNTAAAGDGGGVYVSSASAAAEVVIRSGKVAENHSGGNGGGIAVVNSGSSALADSLTVGVREEHTGLQYSDRSFTVFEYEDSADNATHTHAACPVLKGNTAAGNGGGIYMGSSQATLNIYCLLESKNTSTMNANGNSVMANGGTVAIGDAAANEEGADSSKARGNIKIESSMLVESGTVDIYGNMDNPLFTNNILVNIKSSAGAFTDHREQSSKDEAAINYRVDYFENFTAGGAQNAEGLYIARQYEADVNIPAESALFTHTGWVIVGWSEKEDGTGTCYMVGDMIGTADDHSKWTNDSKTLTLYAIWQRAKYTVKYEPNATGYSGSMPNQQFEYGVEQALTANDYKVKGKRFTGWNTKPDGTGTAYTADYKASQITADNNTEIPLYAQWVDCTHNGGEHPGTLTYTASGSTITETCDCGGHTATVTLGVVSVYFDNAAHPATLTYDGNTLLADTPKINYQYKAAAGAEYGDMPDDTTEPTEIGLYKASITVGGQTVSVEYEIKNANSGIQMTAKIAAGQFFTEFNGSSTDDAPVASIPQDEAFTVQFDVLNLNTETYKTAPVLTFGATLPAGTTIILNTDDAYWYLKVGDGGQTTVALSEFTEMGGSGTYSYTVTDKQQYRFVVDFSQAAMNAATQNITLTYSQTNDNAQQLTTSARLRTTTKDSFGLQWTGSTLTVTAPAQTDRWNGRQLVAVLQADESIPADAKLTAVVGSNTSIYALNARGQFVVPLSWAETQNVSLSLSSDLAAAAGGHSLTASLYVGVNGQKLLTADAAAEGTLTIPVDAAPALKLTGTQHVYTTQDTTLVLTVAMENTNGCTVSAEINKKAGNSYAGTYLSMDKVQAGANNFSLNTINDAGTYRLLVTVTKDNKTLLQVPYYFIVQ